MDDLLGMRNFAETMSQIGIMAFTLMFAAVQIRWHGVDPSSKASLSATRLGKLMAITALWELLTVTLVTVSFLAATRNLEGPLVDPMWLWGWRIVAVMCAIVGYALTWSHHREFATQRQLGYVPTEADQFQHGWAHAPFLSYGLLVVVALWPTMPLHSFAFSAVLVWFLLSGLVETYVTLSPSMLDAELVTTPLAIHVPVSARAAEHPPNAIRCIEFKASALTPKRGTIVVLPDIWGPKYDILALADRLSVYGYRVLILDYYDGSLRPLRWFSVWRRANEQPTRIASDAKAVHYWLTEQGESPASLVGFSIGGAAALLQDDRWDRVVSFYPSSATGMRDALGSVRPSRMRVYLAEKDRDAPLPAKDQSEGVETVRDLLTNKLTRVQPRVIAGARHGFMGSGRSIPLPIRIGMQKWLGPDPIQARLAEHELMVFLGSR